MYVCEGGWVWVHARRWVWGSLAGSGPGRISENIPDMVARYGSQILSRAHSLFENASLVDFQRGNEHKLRKMQHFRGFTMGKVIINRFSKREWVSRKLQLNFSLGTNRLAWARGSSPGGDSILSTQRISGGRDPILSTQRFPRGRDRILSTQRIPRGREPILSTQRIS